jgi:hypothetical protein
MDHLIKIGAVIVSAGLEFNAMGGDQQQQK